MGSDDVPAATDLLEGRVAVVTGGGGGLGAGISEALARHGAAVLLVDVDAERAPQAAAGIVAAGGRAEAVVADVTEPGAARRIVDATVETFGGIDIVVNNVGHFLYGGRPFHETTEEQWEALHDVNLRHVLRMCHAAVPVLIDQRRGGSIVNVSTVEAFRGIPHHAVYGAYKAAVSHFSRCLALDVGRHAIRVNDLAPDVTTSLQVPYDRFLTEDEMAKVPRWVPIGRLGRPADAGGVVVFLASDLGSFVTGTTIHLDGGTGAAGGWFRSEHEPRGWTNRPRDP
jgi:2-hydroxycyclohexanecarboxyl-CoA dehydrogenase